MTVGRLQSIVLLQNDELSLLKVFLSGHPLRVSNTLRVCFECDLALFVVSLHKHILKEVAFGWRFLWCDHCLFSG